jgi:nicotinamide mononucleotide adenylyltransferase
MYNGRFQGVHAGHHAMAVELKKMAHEGGADYIIFGSPTHGDSKNPLSPEMKEAHMKKVLDTNNVIVHPQLANPIDQLQHAHNLGYNEITWIASGKRAREYQKFKALAGRKTTFKDGRVLDLTGIHTINIEEPLTREEKADTGKTEISHKDINPKTQKMITDRISGSRVREAAKNRDFALFHSMMPEHVSKKDSRDMMDDLHKAQTENIQEEVSALTRMKLAKAARRTAARRKVVRRNRSKRRKNLNQLKTRAKNEVVSSLRSKFSGKRNWKKISYSQRVNIDRTLAKRKKLIPNMVKRIMPQVIKGESERLKHLNSSFDPIINNLLSTFISEATKMKSKKVNRQPLDSAGKAKRRRDNTQTQREVRGKRDEKIKSGNVKGEIYAVKNKRGDIELVDRQSLRADHKILLDADKASLATLKKFTGDKGFRNTETSIRLFGLQKDAGGEKEGKKEKKESKKGGKQTAAAAAFNPPPQKIPASKKASKKDIYPTSHDATSMESGICYALNTAMGLSPEEMVKKGLIDKKDLDAVLANQHESFLPSCQRVVEQLMAKHPGLYLKHTGRLKSTTNLSPEAIENGVVDNTPKSDLLLVDKDGNVVAGLSQKIGESQLSSGGPAETVTNLKYTMASVGDKMQPETRKQIEEFIKFFENELSGNPRTKAGPVSLYQQGGEKEGEDKEVKRREQLHDKATEMLNKILNGDKKFASAFIYSLITGAGKFKQGDPAIATHILSANRDGTDMKLTQVDMKYCEKLIDKVKFQMKFKSSAVETTDVKKKWQDFKDHKKKIGQKITLAEDFRQYSYRSVVRAYLTESINFLSGRKLIVSLFESQNSELKKVTPPDPKTPDEAVQYVKDAFNYIGDDYFKLYQFFEDTIDADITQPIIDWTEYADSENSTTNIITINGKQFEIPVEVPYNYTPDGNMESPLSEEYLEEKKKRNYKQEYERYHSRPEQRKNRSKRVLARRLMMKLGKVHKGDGKDVDHKDGNPQNNGKHNLRVRDKSENRADN